jgi:hypothetical protein
LDATVLPEDASALTYLWSADPAGGVVFSATDVEDPTVTITKTAGDAETVTLTVAVNAIDNPDDVKKDTVTIDVYDDACQAAIDLHLKVFDPTDFDGNCITDLADLAEIARAWLVDYAITAPIPK